MNTQDSLDSGLNSWRHAANHNRMIEIQNGALPKGDGSVGVSYYGSSAFKVTSPGGISVMIDPWRNMPSRDWLWYFQDFPVTPVDIGVSTHAHFDHDALHRLDAHVLLDRLIGTFEFGDLRITGIADKHATDPSYAYYDFKRVHKEFAGVEIEPPDNPRSWDNCLIIIETGDLRILHWGDNRHNPPDVIWEAIGDIDIALLPVDDTQHVLGFPHIEAIIKRLNPAIVIPHHYYIWDVVLRQSTLGFPDKWLATQADVRRLKTSSTNYARRTMPTGKTTVDYFGDHVAFDTQKWRNGTA